MSTSIHYATGRRKTSSARVYLSKGEGKIMVNDKELAHYFGRQVAQMLVLQPLRLTELDEQVDVKAMVKMGRSFVGFYSCFEGYKGLIDLAKYEDDTSAKLSKEYGLEINGSQIAFRH